LRSWKRFVIFAESKRIPPALVAIAWVTAQGGDSREQLAEALGSLAVHLAEEDIDAIEKAIPKGAAAGARCPEAQMAHLDSER
jgi:aryl-alcohol dehydrogenase-like predicted oxidoreductase